MLNSIIIKNKKTYKLAVCEIITDTQKAFSQLEKHLSVNEKGKYEQIKNLKRKNEWLTVRLIILKTLKKYYEVKYEESGKPFLDFKYNVSISHTKKYAAVIFSKNKNPGIDIETISDKIINIAHKFMYPQDIKKFRGDEKKKNISLNWSAKETLFKIYGDGNIDFKKDLKIFTEKLKQKGKINAEIRKFNPEKILLKYCFINNNENVLVWYKGNKK